MTKIEEIPIKKDGLEVGKFLVSDKGNMIRDYSLPKEVKNETNFDL